MSTSNTMINLPLASGGGGGSGTVTSVSVSAPSIFSVAGSPITTSGTITLSLANETKNQFFAGPLTGSAAIPTFRSLDVSDFNGGTAASSSTFWRGDGTWANTPGAPSSPSTSLQYNNAGVFAGSSFLTPDSGVSFGDSAFSYGVLQNSFPSSVDFRNPWIGAYASFTAGALAPNGLNNAMHLITATRSVDGIYISSGSSGSNTFTMSCWMKGNTGGEQVYFGSMTNTTSFDTAHIDVFSTAFTLTTSWQRYVFTGFTPTAATQCIGFWTKGTGADFYLFGPQLETNSYAGVFLPTYSNGSGGPPAINGQGMGVSFASIGQLTLGTPLSPFLLDPVSGAASGTRRLTYNTASDYLQYNDNSGTSRQVAIVGSSSHTISSIGIGSFSSGTATINDSSITNSSAILITITSANSPGVYQVSPSSGSASVQSYNTGFSGTNFSDASSFTYVVIN